MILDPTTYNHWDDILACTSGASFFHSAAWAKVLMESYHYKPVYFVDIKNSHITALCALMDVRSSLTGCRGVSLPFTDYCELIAENDEHFQETFKTIVASGKKQNWKYIEFRGGEHFFQNEQLCESFYGHNLDLSAGPQKLFATLRDSTRRNIKKAEKANVTISFSTSSAALAEFYRLNTQTRRDHGLPPQPYYFFKCLQKHVLTNNLGFIILAHFNDKAIAGNVFLHFGDQVIYKYGASDKAFQHLRANNLVMWEAIRWGCNKGYKSFCFGRTEPVNEGLRQFKTGWGAQENIIKYYRYDLQKEAFIKANQTISPLYNKIFNKAPIPILKAIGSLLYRHMG